MTQIKPVGGTGGSGGGGGFHPGKPRGGTRGSGGSGGNGKGGTTSEEPKPEAVQEEMIADAEERRRRWASKNGGFFLMLPAFGTAMLASHQTLQRMLPRLLGKLSAAGRQSAIQAVKSGAMAVVGRLGRVAIAGVACATVGAFGGAAGAAAGFAVGIFFYAVTSSTAHAQMTSPFEQQLRQLVNELRTAGQQRQLELLRKLFVLIYRHQSEFDIVVDETSTRISHEIGRNPRSRTDLIQNWEPIRRNYNQTYRQAIELERGIIDMALQLLATLKSEYKTVAAWQQNVIGYYEPIFRHFQSLVATHHPAI